jgi:hypothetical protein
MCEVPCLESRQNNANIKNTYYEKNTVSYEANHVQTGGSTKQLCSMTLKHDQNAWKISHSFIVTYILYSANSSRHTRLKEKSTSLSLSVLRTQLCHSISPSRIWLRTYYTYNSNQISCKLAKLLIQ